ncbi:MAG: ABC transporter substrate-binding protein, partial [Halobacteriaceae archaeon]
MAAEGPNVGNELTRRKLLRSGAGAAALSLAGCGAFDNGSGADKTPDAITFLHFETQASRISTIKELGNTWQQQSGIELNQRDVAEADLPAEIQSSIASNTLPATAELSTRALYSARNALHSNDAKAVIEAIGTEKFYDNTLKFASDGRGGYYGVPLYTWQQLTLYRKSVKEEMGLPVPNTWENFREFASATHDPENNVYGCLLGSDKSQFTLQCFQPFALSNDAHVFDTAGNIVFDSEEMIEALNFYAEMCKKYNPPGDMGSGDVGQVWGNKQTHLYSSNTISFYFEALGMKEGTVQSLGVSPKMNRKRNA